MGSIEKAEASDISLEQLDRVDTININNYHGLTIKIVLATLVQR